MSTAAACIDSVRLKPGVLKKIKIATGLRQPDADTGKGRNKSSSRIGHGFKLVEGKANHPMEDYLVVEFRHINGCELGLFAIFDGHMGHEIPVYLQSHLFDNIINQPEFWREPATAVVKAYTFTDKIILENSGDLGCGGSTAVTAILINGARLVVGNLGDSRAVLCRDGDAIQLSVDHEPNSERTWIERRGGFIATLPGDVPRVDGQLAVARAFGDKNLKPHLSCEPDVLDMLLDETDEFLILASDGLWKVMENQDAVNLIRKVKDCDRAAKVLVEAALTRKSKDDISCVVVRFK